MISILIVEDQLEHQMYLNTIINTNTEFKNLGIIRLGNEAIIKIKDLKPDIVLMDIGLPDISGIECIIKLKPICPDVKFLICSVHEEDELIFEALKAGANGYILKKNKPYQIIDAIFEMQAGDSPISSIIARKILKHYAEPKPETLPEEYSITVREAELLTYLAKGLSYQEIADQTFISVKTLRWHVCNIYKKLHANNRTEALNAYFGKKS